MIHALKLYPETYVDSIVQLSGTRALFAVDGVDWASAAMATPAKVETLRGEGFDASERRKKAKDGVPLVPVAFGAQNSASQGDGVSVGYCPTLDKSKIPAVAFDMRGREGGAMPEGPHDTANIRAASGGSSRSYIAQPWAVRRLTPTECARLQGFPDDHTAITYRRKPAADGPQYKAHGNSMAVPVIRWVMDRMRISMGGAE